MLPREDKSGELLDLASSLARESGRLAGGASLPVRQAIAPLLRAMNSYYSNKIEGQHTLPSDIARALKQDFGDNLDLVKRQKLAVAHLRTEEALEEEVTGKGPGQLYDVHWVGGIHRHLFEHLSPEDRTLEDGTVVEPGTLRMREVQVGHHVPPNYADVPAFMRRWSEAYGNFGDGARSLLAVACAHHRLAWIHPFLDGNGRVARLHSHLVLHASEHSNGIWSVMRGLARTHQEYFERLHLADGPREGDLDGRGNLSERRLLEFAEYFLRVCLDQVRFMSRMLHLEDFRDRLKALLAYESVQDSRIRMDALAPMHYVFLTGAVSRQDFKRMTGLHPKTAQKLLAALLSRELLESNGPASDVRFRIPLHALRFYFPQLWPEAEAELVSRR